MNSILWDKLPYGGHREVVWLLITGAGLLGGCQTLSGYKPVLPDSCVWVKVPHTWICIDPREGEGVIPREDTELWEALPLSMLESTFDPPLSVVDVLDLCKGGKRVDWKEVVEANINPNFALKRWAMFGDLSEDYQ